MKILILIVVFLLIFAALYSLKAKKETAKSREHDFDAKEPLTKNEQEVYWRLVKYLPDHVVLAQVGLSRCLGTKNRAAFATIAQKSLDFVICNREMQILVVIEIDDKSHNSRERKIADAAKDKALKSAKIPILRWPALPLPTETEITMVANRFKEPA